MKDMPAFLCAYLSTVNTELFETVFNKVITDGRMLRTFVQIMRSGVVGRKSLGSCPKRAIRHWFASRTADAIFRNSIGTDPSIADIIKMVHPKPVDEEHKALYAYLINRPYDQDHLPYSVKQLRWFLEFEGHHGEVPDLPFQMLTSSALDPFAWSQIARHASWKTTLMNINTFYRHDVFKDYPETTQAICDKLKNAEIIKSIKVFPYQIMAAYTSIDENVPKEIYDALVTAMEKATANVPSVEGTIAICPDVSCSMQKSITGKSKVPSKIRCIDVAALITSVLHRKNLGALILPFDDRLHLNVTNSDATIMDNAEALANICGGSTDCHVPLVYLNENSIPVDVIIYVSDNESWVQLYHNSYRSGTNMQIEWAEYKQKHPNTKLICLDLTPNSSVQIKDSKDVLNIGGFSDNVFDIINKFISNKSSGSWTETIEEVKI